MVGIRKQRETAVADLLQVLAIRGAERVGEQRGERGHQFSVIAFSRGSARVDHIEHDDRCDRRQPGVEGDERREVVGEGGPTELEHLGPARAVTDSVPAEALEAQIVVERVGREVGDGGGGDNLATVGDRAESSGAVHRGAHEVAVTAAHLARVERDPDPDLDTSGPLRLRERALRRGCGVHRAGDRREDDEVAVTFAA